MRVLCDEHIPFQLVNRLREMGVDATHVNRVLDGSGTSDPSDLRVRRSRRHASDHKGWQFSGQPLSLRRARALSITLGNLANAELVILVERYREAIVESAALQRCYLELSREGLIRLPPAR